MFDGSYPLPSHTIALSLRADGKLQVYMPGRNSPGHSVTVTPNERGLSVILNILKERSLVQDDRRTISGDMIAPTQQIVDEWLRHNKPTTPNQPQVNVNIDLDDLLGGKK